MQATNENSTVYRIYDPPGPSWAIQRRGDEDNLDQHSGFRRKSRTVVTVLPERKLKTSSELENRERPVDNEDTGYSNDFRPRNIINSNISNNNNYYNVGDHKKKISEYKIPNLSTDKQIDCSEILL